VTVALGTAAPEESFTVPLNAPVAEDWLNDAGANNVVRQNRTAKPNTKARLRVIIDTLIHPFIVS